MIAQPQKGHIALVLKNLFNERGQIPEADQEAEAEILDSSVDTPASEPLEPGAADEAKQAEDRRRLRLWRKRIAEARKLRKDWEKEYRVKETEEYYLGKQYGSLPDNTAAINHFLATVRVTLPNLVFDDPKFLVRAKPGFSAPAVQTQAKVAEGALESVCKQDDNLRSASRFAVLQNFFRIAILKVVYDPTLEPNPKAGQPIFQQLATGEIAYDPMTGQPMPEVDPETQMPITEPEMVLSDEAYRFEWVDASKFLIPDEGPDMTKWPWVAEEIEMPLDEAKEDPRFPAELRAMFRPSKQEDYDSAETDSSYSPDDSSGEKFDEEETFCYCVIYDLKKKAMYAVARDSSIKDFLIDGPLPDGIKDHPYAILPGWLPNIGPDGGSPWPLPFTNPWLDLQDEYNLRRLQMRNGASRSARKIAATKGMFENDEEARKALQSSTDMETFYVKDITKLPVVLEDPDISPAVYKDAQAVLSDWRLVTGQTGAKIGTPDADTATEATFVQQASNLRDADLQKDVNAFFRVAGRKMLQLIRDTITLEMYVNIRGMDDTTLAVYMQTVYGIPVQALMAFPELKEEVVRRFGKNKMERVTREDLNGNFNVDVVPGSTKPRNLSVERTQWLEFLNLIATAPQIALSKLLLEETASKYDFINPAMVEEVHALAIQMVQASQMQAGRGGENSHPGNTKGTTSQSQNGKVSQTAQGNEVE